MGYSIEEPEFYLAGDQRFIRDLSMVMRRDGVITPRKFERLVSTLRSSLSDWVVVLPLAAPLDDPDMSRAAILSRVDWTPPGRRPPFLRSDPFDWVSLLGESAECRRVRRDGRLTEWMVRSEDTASPVLGGSRWWFVVIVDAVLPERGISPQELTSAVGVTIEGVIERLRAGQGVVDQEFANLVESLRLYGEAQRHSGYVPADLAALFVELEGLLLVEGFAAEREGDDSLLIWQGEISAALGRATYLDFVSPDDAAPEQAGNPVRAGNPLRRGPRLSPKLGELGWENASDRPADGDGPDREWLTSSTAGVEALLGTGTSWAVMRPVGEVDAAVSLEGPSASGADGSPDPASRASALVRGDRAWPGSDRTLLRLRRLRVEGRASEWLVSDESGALTHMAETSLVLAVQPVHSLTHWLADSADLELVDACFHVGDLLRYRAIEDSDRQRLVDALGAARDVMKSGSGVPGLVVGAVASVVSELAVASLFLERGWDSRSGPQHNAPAILLEVKERWAEMLEVASAG